MKKSFAVIGLGSFGLALVEELSKYTDNIIAVDSVEEQVEKATKFINQCFILQATNEEALKSIGIENIDHAIICFGTDLEDTILTLVNLKNLGVKKITVRCDNDRYLPILEKLGATDIFSPQKLAGIRLGNRIINDNFVDFFNLTNEFSIVEVTTPEHMQEISIIDLDSRNRFGVNIILIRRKNQSIAPKATDVIMAGDRIFVFGKQSQILKFSNSLVDA